MGIEITITEQEVLDSGLPLEEAVLAKFSELEGRKVVLDEIEIVSVAPQGKILVIRLNDDISRSVVSAFKITFDELIGIKTPLDQYLVERYIADFGNKIAATDIQAEIDMVNRVILARVKIEYIKENP